MEQTKDYSLLRPFDLEAAKAGELLFEIYMHGSKVKTDEDIGTYIAGPNNLNEYVISYPTNGYVTYTFSIKDVRMAPLAWVEGKPVYKGDTLYWNNKSRYPGAVFTVGSKIVFEQLISGKTVMSDGTVYPDDNESGMLAINLTWNKPKVKKSGWMNSYDSGEHYVYPTKDRADVMATHSRKACIEIFWEE